MNEYLNKTGQVQATTVEKSYNFIKKSIRL